MEDLKEKEEEELAHDYGLASLSSLHALVKQTEEYS